MDFQVERNKRHLQYVHQVEFFHQVILSHVVHHLNLWLKKKKKMIGKNQKKFDDILEEKKRKKSVSKGCTVSQWRNKNNI